ncbi:MAG: HEAT repeat domain-containing protein [Candidatus Bathyarchaeota archaeon]|nr:MAG: HEAT repeat domain-containing protein [Candidatus Bathyarchaeota archaeon]
MNNNDSLTKNSSQKPNTKPKQGNCNSLTPLKRFEASMAIGFEEWHDGIGYDIEALRTASQAERDAIEQILINHSPRDWRDIEALAEINTKCARETIKEAMKDPNPVVRVAVTRYAPDLVTDNERTQSLTDALQDIEPFWGLSQVLAEVEIYHPEEVKEALIKGLLNREGEVAVHFAAMLFYLFGKAKEPFDWGKRPFFLRFNTEDSKERVKVFRELCQKLKINPEKYMR